MPPFFKTLLSEISDWSEVVSIAIPLCFLMIRKTRSTYLRPVVAYVWIAFVINFVSILIQKFQYELPDNMRSNNFLYNSGSVVRLVCFSLFFILLKQPFMSGVKKAIPIFFLIFLLINFIFFEDFFYYWTISSRLLATEAALLLFLSLQYFIYLMYDEQLVSVKKLPTFWIVTGLSIYVCASFLVYLFYEYMLKYGDSFVLELWDIHNASYFVFCILLTKGLYEDSK